MIKFHSGEIDSVKFLLENGADINGRDAQLQTPLHIAAYNGNASKKKIYQIQNDLE